MTVQEQIDELTSRYWRIRCAEGGTIIDGEGRTDHSAEAEAVWKEVGEIITNAAVANRAWLVSVGVPESLSFSATHNPIEEVHGGLLWRGAWPWDGYSVDRFLPGYEIVEEWTNWGGRYVWTDNTTTIITYCEGDLSTQFFDDPAKFANAYRLAGEFYAQG